MAKISTAKESRNGPSIAVVGVGALGSEVCRQLAENSFLNVVVIDPDPLEKRNVPGSLIYQNVISTKGNKALDQFKVNLLCDEINRRYGLHWSAIAEEIADVGLGLLTGIDLILSCTDSTLARVETTRAAHILGVPMIDGGVMSKGIAAGRVSWFTANRNAACYLCGISEIRRAMVLTYAASASLGCSVGDEEFPAMTASFRTVQETATAMLLLLLQRQRGRVPIERSFAVRLQDDLQEQWSQFFLDLPRSVTCPWHDNEPEKWSPILEDKTIKEILTDDNFLIQLPWPQCLTAYCRVCGTDSKPFRRLAWVRRKAICTHCGTKGSSEPVEVIDTLLRTDQRAKLMLWQLGLPKQHLYLLRRSFVPTKRKDF